MNPTDAPPFLSSIGAPWPVRALTVTIRYDSTLGNAVPTSAWRGSGCVLNAGECGCLTTLSLTPSHHCPSRRALMAYRPTGRGIRRSQRLSTVAGSSHRRMRSREAPGYVACCTERRRSDD